MIPANQAAIIAADRTGDHSINITVALSHESALNQQGIHFTVAGQRELCGMDEGIWQGRYNGSIYHIKCEAQPLDELHTITIWRAPQLPMDDDDEAHHDSTVAGPPSSPTPATTDSVPTTAAFFTHNWSRSDVIKVGMYVLLQVENHRQRHMIMRIDSIKPNPADPDHLLISGIQMVMPNDLTDRQLSDLIYPLASNEVIGRTHVLTVSSKQICKLVTIIPTRSTRDMIHSACCHCDFCDPSYIQRFVFEGHIGSALVPHQELRGIHIHQPMSITLADILHLYLYSHVHRC